MSRPKGKLLALVAVFGAIAVAAGTGAFTTVSAERTADVNVAGDSGALLAIDAASGANGAYADTNNGEFQLNLGGPQGANGVNPNATTAVDGVFTITNQGTQAVTVYLTRSGANPAAIEFAIPTSEIDGSASDEIGIPGSGSVATITTDGSSPANGITLDTGESITVGFYVDTTDADPTDGDRTGGTSLGDSDEIITSVTITAEADPTATFENQYDAASTSTSTSTSS